MSSQWLIILVCYAFICLVVGLWFREDQKKRKVKDAHREATLAAIGMLVAQHNSDVGVDSSVFSATYMLIGIHLSPKAAGWFSNSIEGTDNQFYFPACAFRSFISFRLDSGFTVKELLYHGDYSLHDGEC